MGTTTSQSGLYTMRMGHKQITMHVEARVTQHNQRTAWQEGATQTYIYEVAELFKTEQAALKCLCCS